jgi:hypothetical protein
MGAILLFGFGDTLTSLLVFVRGGSEANLLFQAILRVLGPSTLNFVLVKMAATVLALLAARLQPRVEGLVAWAMLLLGAFLVAQNSMALLAG